MAAPQRVLQSMEESCWAACMQCWSKEAFYYTARYENELVKSFSDKTTGGLDTEGEKFKNFLDVFWLTKRVFQSGTLPVGKIKTWLLTGFFIVIVKTGQNTSHARLVYDYDEATDTLLMMEPDAGQVSPFTGKLSLMPNALILYLDPKKMPGGN